MGWQKLGAAETYDIDLTKPPQYRWDEVIGKDLPAAKLLAAEALQDVEHVPFWTSRALAPFRKTIAWSYRRMGLYGREIGAWADALGITFEDMLVLQYSYEVSHAAEWYAYGIGDVAKVTPFGCTAGIKRWQKKLVHVRNMDWPLNYMGQATRLFRYVAGDDVFYSVGVTGHVGVISGMVPHGYSVTLNWAPPTGYPSLSRSASFVLRELLTNVKDYDHARKTLHDAVLPTNALLAICGTKRREAEIIERTKGDFRVRVIPANEPLCVANHFEVDKFQYYNKLVDVDNDIGADSRIRKDMLEQSLSGLAPDAATGLFMSTLDGEFVFNDNTTQQMLFVPADGTIEVYSHYLDD